METFENKSQNQDPFVTEDENASGIKHKLGQLGRRIKRVDLRSQIIAHPFAAIGIAAGVGAVIGLARPMPRRSRISGAVVAALSTLGFRLAREAVMVQLSDFAKQRLGGQHDAREGMASSVPQSGTTATRY